LLEGVSSLAKQWTTFKWVVDEPCDKVSDNTGRAAGRIAGMAEMVTVGPGVSIVQEE
jgi:hypothetical protein